MGIKTVIASAIALALSSTAVNAATITTIPFWDGSSFIGSWGGAATNTYGEVLKAQGTSLNSFTFEVNNGGSAANYVAQVYAWAGSNTAGGPLGLPLFTSSASIMPGLNGFQAVTINTGGVAVTQGQEYSVMLYDNSADGVSALWGIIRTHPGVTGDVGFNFNNGPSNVNGTFFDFGSLAYEANFSNGAVPEPATWAMMLMGFGMVGFALRGRRRQNVRVSYA